MGIPQDTLSHKYSEPSNVPSISRDNRTRENLKSLRKNNKEMEKLLASLKVPRAEAVHSTRKIHLLNLQGPYQRTADYPTPPEINKFDLQVNLPRSNIFDSSKMTSVFIKQKEPMSAYTPPSCPTLNKEKKIMEPTNMTKSHC